MPPTRAPIFLVFGKTVRTPSFLHNGCACEMLENGFGHMARYLVAAQSKVFIEWRKERASTTLPAPNILTLKVLLSRPILLIESLGFGIGKAIGDYFIGIHGLQADCYGNDFQDSEILGPSFPESRFVMFGILHRHFERAIIEIHAWQSHGSILVFEVGFQLLVFGEIFVVGNIDVDLSHIGRNAIGIGDIAAGLPADAVFIKP